MISRVLYLALEPPWPPNDGGRLRNFHLLQSIARLSEVTLLAFTSSKAPACDIAPIREVCKDVLIVNRPTNKRPSLGKRVELAFSRRPQAMRLYDSREMAALLVAAATNGRIDVVHVDDLYLAAYAAHIRDVPKVLNHQNVEATSQRRLLLRDPAARSTLYGWLRWLEHLQWCAFERHSLAWFDGHVAVSELDARYFRRYSGNVPVWVVPNGVDTRGIQMRSDPGGPPTLVYVGSMDYPPNAEAVRSFVIETFPMIERSQPDVRLLLVGRNPPPSVVSLTRSNVIVTGTVPDVAPYYEQSHVAIVPLISGGGTRLKILEALAQGVPVVSTPVGAEGLDLTPDQDLLIANTPESFASRVVQLLNEPALRAALASHGRRTVATRYDWNKIGEGLLEVYALAAARSRRTQLREVAEARQ
ncbi:MAG TPA: glycosyltransferase [Anaerolineae bacterium]|nr:glycosyltransferase [Anaerolineae bacterium]HQJ52344.1 glycosyltransferase [Anaerolineae bacterium]